MSRYGNDEANFYNYDIIDDRDFVIDKYYMNDFSDVDDPNFLGALRQIKPVRNKMQRLVTIPKSVHPLLPKQKYLEGQMGSWLDNIVGDAKAAVKTAIASNQEKLMQAGTAQLTNIVGGALTKLSATSPQAQQAISQVVSTATKSAQMTVMDTIKQKFEENKIPIMIGGGALIALIAYALYRKK